MQWLAEAAYAAMQGLVEVAAQGLWKAAGSGSNGDHRRWGATEAGGG